jgi:hypothetical protein
MTNVQGGAWHADPSGSHELRYYDGQWTDHVSDNGVVSSSPLTPPTQAAAVAQPVAQTAPAANPQHYAPIPTNRVQSTTEARPSRKKVFWIVATVVVVGVVAAIVIATSGGNSSHGNTSSGGGGGTGGGGPVSAAGFCKDLQTAKSDFDQLDLDSAEGDTIPGSDVGAIHHDGQLLMTEAPANAQDAAKTLGEFLIQWDPNSNDVGLQPDINGDLDFNLLNDVCPNLN